MKSMLLWFSFWIILGGMIYVGVKWLFVIGKIGGLGCWLGKEIKEEEEVFESIFFL